MRPDLLYLTRQYRSFCGMIELLIKSVRYDEFPEDQMASSQAW